VIPPADGALTGELVPTVEVLFGTELGIGVTVLSSTRLFVRPPRSPLPAIKPDYGEGLVDVTVRNVDEDGVVIGAETITAEDAYRYQRQQLTNESDLSRLVRTLVQELRKQVVANVSTSTHSDFDFDVSDELSIVDVANLPALVIFGPMLQENRFFSRNVPTVTEGTGGELIVRRVPDTDDLMFSFVGISDQKIEALNLQVAMRQFFKKNKWLALQRDPSDSSFGFVKYEMQLDAAGMPFNSTADQKSNLRSFSGSFVVRGFDHEDLPGFLGDDVIGRTKPITEISVTSSNKDG
jgi:hypothetical protein